MRKGDLLMGEYFCPVTIKNVGNHEIPVLLTGCAATSLM